MKKFLRILKNIKDVQELSLIIITIVMCVVVVTGVVLSLTFLGSQLNRGISDTSGGPSQTIKFDLDGAKRLGIE